MNAIFFSKNATKHEAERRRRRNDNEAEQEKEEEEEEEEETVADKRTGNVAAGQSELWDN